MLDQDECTKFALVVFKQELASFKLNFRVAPRHRDIIDSQITLMPPAQLEHSFAGARAYYMNNSGVVLLLRERFQHHEVSLGFFVLDQVVCLDQPASIGGAIGAAGLALHLQWVGRLANLALERLPEERLEVGAHFRLLPGLEPV